MESLSDLVDQLRLYGVDVFWSTVLDVPALWWAGYRVLILGVGQSAETQAELCRQTLDEVLDRIRGESSPRIRVHGSRETQDPPEDFLSLALRAAPDGLTLTECWLAVRYAGQGRARVVAAVRKRPWVTETRERRADTRGHVRTLIVLRAV